jgi:GntR family transcriptional regulator, rspAB operon transcriptional repressor
LRTFLAPPLKPAARNAATSGQPARPSGESLTEEVYQLLKWRILAQKGMPSGLFTEEDLCKLLEYGRSPVHQALHRLQYDGLVEILPRKGIVVRSFSRQQIEDLIEIRLPLEVEMARLAALRAPEDKVAALQKLLAGGHQLIKRGDLEGLMTLDREFHRGVAACTGNAVLVEVLENLHQRSLILWHASAPGGGQYGAVQAEHEAILEAVTGHDAKAAVTAMKHHLSRFAGDQSPERLRVA